MIGLPQRLESINSEGIGLEKANTRASKMLSAALPPVNPPIIAPSTPPIIMPGGPPASPITTPIFSHFPL